jgi:hypothetical protein
MRFVFEATTTTKTQTPQYGTWHTIPDPPLSRQTVRRPRNAWQQQNVWFKIEFGLSRVSTFSNYPVEKKKVKSSITYKRKWLLFSLRKLKNRYKLFWRFLFSFSFSYPLLNRTNTHTHTNCKLSN